MAARKVTVLLGGWSAERDVSLISGAACAKALSAAGYDVTKLDPPRDLGRLAQALDPKPDVIFNALHGRYGEDGTIQSLLDIMKIPYTHSGRLASSLAMDKPMAIALFRAAGIPCPQGRVISPAQLGSDDPMPRPYVVKPAQEGSSVGVYIVKPGTSGPDYSDWTYGDALVEEFIPGQELTVSVMGGRALCVTELQPHSGFYDFEAKYSDGKTTHICPAEIDPALSRTLMQHALHAHQLLGCRGVTRSDFRYDPKTEKLAILEINTQPGMTSLSLVPEQAKQAGIDFTELVSWMVENAKCDA